MADDDGTGEVPRFAHALLGYDRYQVEEYIGRLHDWALEAQARAADLEHRLELRDEELRALKVLVKGGSAGAESSEGAADQAGAVIVNSFDELVRLRREAAEESERAIESARAQALQVVRNARELAERIVGEAQDERDRVRREADRMLEEARTRDARRPEDRPPAARNGAAVEPATAGTGHSASGHSASGSPDLDHTIPDGRAGALVTGDLSGIVTRLRRLNEDLQSLGLHQGDAEVRNPVGASDAH